MKNSRGPSIPTLPEFRRGYKAFQARDPRGAMYSTATFLVAHFWGKPREMADGLGVLLLTWNQAFYRYGQFDFARLESTLRKHMARIKKFRCREIESFTEKDEPAVKQLFVALLDALKISEGNKRGCKSPVAVAKALHLLAPAFMPPWDEKIARAYRCVYALNPDEKYVRFMYNMQTLARRFRNHSPAGRGRSVLKLIDEYNYAKYTQQWV